MPVFSSIDGYVCFFLAIDKVTPAKRKIGIFNLPKPGVTARGLRLDFRSVQMARQDWDRILDLVKPLDALDLDGSVEVCWPDAECYRSARQPLVFKDQIYLTADSGTTLVIGYSERMQSVTLHRLQSTTACTAITTHDD